MFFFVRFSAQIERVGVYLLMLLFGTSSFSHSPNSP